MMLKKFNIFTGMFWVIVMEKSVSITSFSTVNERQSTSEIIANLLAVRTIKYDKPLTDIPTLQSGSAEQAQQTRHFCRTKNSIGAKNLKLKLSCQYIGIFIYCTH